jgi:hypothetical protein
MRSVRDEGNLLPAYYDDGHEQGYSQKDGTDDAQFVWLWGTVLSDKS